MLELKADEWFSGVSPEDKSNKETTLTIIKASLFLCDLKKEEKPLTKWKTMGLLYSATVVCLSGYFICLFADDVLLFVSSHWDLQNTPQWFASATTAAASEWITRMKTWWTWEWRLQSRKTGSLRNLDYVVDSPIHHFKSLYWAKSMSVYVNTPINLGGNKITVVWSCPVRREEISHPCSGYTVYG